MPGEIWNYLECSETRKIAWLFVTFVEKLIISIMIGYLCPTCNVTFGRVMTNKGTKNRKKIRKCLLWHKKRTFTSKLKVTYSRTGDLECGDLRENQIETRLLARSCSVACFFLYTLIPT